MNIERRIAPIHLELREDGRTLYGMAVPYGVETRIGRYTEKFVFGAFADARPEDVPVLATHDHEDLPVGRAITLTEMPAGLKTELRVSQTRRGDELLELVKDGAVTGLSVGFVPVEDRWNPARTVVERIRAKLVELSLTAFPQYQDARILAVRSEDELLRTPRLTVARYNL
jgi:HK97 family phage prohead protease